MRETFPNWQPGGDLSAADLRKMADTARRGSTPFPASYQQGYEGGSQAEAPARIAVLVITEEVSGSLKTYKARPMWYDDGTVAGEITESASPSWKDNTDYDGFEWDVDAASINSSLAINDQIVAYWHDQRNAWVPMGSGGGSECDPQNAIIQITVLGSPTGGSFTIDLEVNGVTETITFQWDDDTGAVLAALANHSEITSSDVNVSAGPFPNATMEIEFINDLANTPIPVPTANYVGLTGGSGVAVINSLAQLGIE